MKLRHRLIQLSRYSDSEKKVFAVYTLKLLRNINKSLPCQGVFTLNSDYIAKNRPILTSKTQHRQVQKVIWTCKSWVFCYVDSFILVKLRALEQGTVGFNGNHVITGLMHGRRMNFIIIQMTDFWNAFCLEFHFAFIKIVSSILYIFAYIKIISPIQSFYWVTKYE